MTISSRPIRTIVKVIRAAKRTADSDALAIVHGRHGSYPAEIALSPEVRDALGNDVSGYFEAERIAGQWFVGKRLPHSEHRDW